MGQRQEVGAGADAGSTVEDGIPGGRLTQQRFQLGPQRSHRHEVAVLGPIFLVEVVDGARNVAGDFVIWFDFSPVPFAATGVYQQRRRRRLIGRGQPLILRYSIEFDRAVPPFSALNWKAAIGPISPASVQHRHRLVAHVAQHPPETAGNGAVNIIIGDDLFLLVYAQAAEHRFHFGR